MPYIKQEYRRLIDEDLHTLISTIECEIKKNEDIDGVLNYVITKILNSFYKDKYHNYCRALGTLEAVKQEFYRRVISEYESKKLKENGEVY